MKAQLQQEHEQQQAGPSPAARRAAVALVLGLTLLWRLPSLWDPPWVNDEGTYFAIAQSLAHGYRLYTDVWENKPPLVYLLYYGVDRFMGPSLIAVRLLATVSTLSVVLLTVALARRFVHPERAVLAGLFSGLLLGVPFLEGTTANAEIFVAPLAAAAFYWVIRRGRVIAAGLAIGVAVLLKVVAAFDGAALGLVLLWYSPRAVPRYVGAGLCAPALAVAIAGAYGILPAMLRDALLYDFGYVGRANGGSVPWVLLMKIAVLAAGTWLLWKHPFPYLWLLYATGGALISGRFFGHYAIQMVVPLTLCLGLWTRRVPIRLLQVAVPGLFAVGAAAAATVGWSMAASGHDSIFARRLQYVANAGRFALATESRREYQGQIDDHVNRNIALANRMRTLPRGSLLVWGNVPWLYVLSGRLPATPYTSALRVPEVPGETATLRRAVLRDTPKIVVVIRPAAPPLGSAAAALRRNYRVAGSVDNGTIYLATGRVRAH